MCFRISAFVVGVACLIANADRVGGQDKKDPKDKKVDPKKWDLPGFIKKVEKMPAEEQVKAVQEKLQELNAGFREFTSHKIEDGAVVHVAFDTRYVSDISLALRYRPELFGEPFSELLQQVMKGPSEWTEAERELFAAFVSALNQCPF